MSRFTIDGSDDLESRLLGLCEEVRRRVLEVVPRRLLAAFVLGGGYGRGEGGVLSTSKGDEPYNDLEFYVLVRGFEMLASRLCRTRLVHLAEDLSRKAGVEVELKLLALGKLQRSEVTMFYYDLVSGHRTISGDDGWPTRCEHHRAAHRIPLHEATRLLMNRCSGLLFAQDRLGATDACNSEDADFIGRNLAKAKLAFGDVILAMRGQYHWSCLERQKRLKKISAEREDGALSQFVLLHEQGVEFKLHPVRTARPALELRSELSFLKEIARELWLQLESRRLAKTFRSVADYTEDTTTKCPETNSLKNRLINTRTFGIRGLADERYPRERLLRSLPVFLWEAPTLPGTGETLREYEALWRNFN